MNKTLTDQQIVDLAKQVTGWTTHFQIPQEPHGHFYAGPHHQASVDNVIRIVRAALLAAQQPEPRTDVTDEQPSLTNPLTPYGMLVRALRIVAGTLLGDMAKHLGCSSAALSAVEFGRKPLTDAMVADTAAYFSGVGIPDTLHALNAARAGEGHADQA